MYSKTVLPNGVRVVSENMPGVRSACCGIWVSSGSRLEPAAFSGASHFIEHMVFKGTPSRTAADIAAELDAIGGQANAFTTKESTCFYIKTLDMHLKAGLDVLFDMFFNFSCREEDVQLERSVVLEEIAMCEDTPDDLVIERLESSVFAGGELAHSVLGTKKAVSSLTGESLRAWHDKNYLPERMIVSLAGSIPEGTHEKIAELFSKIPVGKARAPKAQSYKKCETFKRKRIEQTHTALAFPGVPAGDPARYDIAVLNAIFGGSMSSRLFQELREKRGLCYSVASYAVSYSDAGLIEVATACAPESRAEALDLIVREAQSLTQNGVSESELSRAREQLKAEYLMGLETTGARMSHLAKSELLYGRALSPDEIIAGYDSVSSESVLAAARRVLDVSQMSVSTVGRAQG